MTEAKKRKRGRLEGYDDKVQEKVAYDETIVGVSRTSDLGEKDAVGDIGKQSCWVGIAS